MYVNECISQGLEKLLLETIAVRGHAGWGIWGVVIRKNKEANKKWHSQAPTNPQEGQACWMDMDPEVAPDMLPPEV